MRRTTLLCALLGALALAAPAQGAMTVGIADQKSELFADGRFAALGITQVRRAVAWDALRYDWQVRELDTWLQRARALGVEPLLTFSQSRIEGRTRIAPSPLELREEFRRFRARYPSVTNWSAWNEANYCGQPTCKHPGLVALYWKTMSQECPTCRVLAADLLDLPSMPTWVRGFLAMTRGRQPAFWGLHNYVTANRFQTKSITDLLAITTGELWLTETGGLVARRNKSTIKLPEGIAHAATVTRFILSQVPRLSPRITRAYLYQWNTSSATDSWDSGFVGPDNVPRPSLDVLRQLLPPAPPLRIPPENTTPEAVPPPPPEATPEPSPGG